MCSSQVVVWISLLGAWEAAASGDTRGPSKADGLPPPRPQMLARLDRCEVGEAAACAELVDAAVAWNETTVFLRWECEQKGQAGACYALNQGQPSVMQAIGQSRFDTGATILITLSLAPPLLIGLPFLAWREDTQTNVSPGDWETFGITLGIATAAGLLLGGTIGGYLMVSAQALRDDRMQSARTFGERLHPSGPPLPPPAPSATRPTTASLRIAF